MGISAARISSAAPLKSAKLSIQAKTFYSQAARCDSRQLLGYYIADSHNYGYASPVVGQFEARTVFFAKLCVCAWRSLRCCLVLYSYRKVRKGFRKERKAN
jgi:hypothetical protein